MNWFKSLSIIFILFAFSSCVHEKSVNNQPNQFPKPASLVTGHIYAFESPGSYQTIVPGQQISIKLKKSDSTKDADSIALFLDGKPVGILTDINAGISIGLAGIDPGIKRLKLTAFFKDGQTESTSIPLRFISDIKPKHYTYRVIAEFPHDIHAYTQGFEYHDGYFIEGTGQYRESTLRKVLPATGEFIKYRNISPELFGEGITVLNGKIYQLTWREKIGFVYDADNFEQVRKFSFENAEGWGLCNNLDEIIMSDGTNVLYFRDPQYFSINRKIEVFDDISEVDSLNELEYINGVIYANRYMTNEIVMIDPASGKVTGKVDMKGILKREDLNPEINVLNGIAWDSAGKRLFLTGKNWPKVYQVEFLEK